MKIKLEFEAALKILRDRFNELNGDLFNKIKIYKETGTISGVVGDIHFDYIPFAKILEKGFHSTDLHYLFEFMIYLHYFKGINQPKLIVSFCLCGRCLRKYAKELSEKNKIVEENLKKERD